MSLSSEDSPVFTVVVSEKGGAERREAFNGTQLTVGRVQGNDLMLPKGNVSKRHARLLFRDGRFIVTDLNSTNGTYVNRRRISQATIVREGDRIYIGDFVLRIEPGASTGSSTAEGATYAVVPRVPQPSQSEADGLLSADEDEPGTDFHRAGEAAPSVSSSVSGPAPASSEVSESQPSPRSSSPTNEFTATPSRDGPVDEALAAHRSVVFELVERTRAELKSEVGVTQPNAEQTARAEASVQKHLEALRSEGRLPSGVEAQHAQRQALAELLGTGPIGELLADPEVTDISVSRFDRVIAQRRGRRVPVEPPFTSEESLRQCLFRLCARTGQALAEDELVVERRLADGSVVSALTSQVASRVVLSVKKPRRISRSLEELVRAGTISRAIAIFLAHCVQARLCMLITGSEHGMLSVAAALCASAGNERLVLATGVDDLAPDAAAAVRLNLDRAGDRGRQALELAMGLPDCRAVVALKSPELCDAFISGVAKGSNGVLALYEANSAAAALSGCAQDLSLAVVGRDVLFAQQLVSNTFDLVVEVTRLRDRRARVLRIAEVVGFDQNGVKLSDIFRFQVERTAAGGAIEGTFTAVQQVPSVLEKMLLRGVVVQSSMFARPPSR